MSLVQSPYKRERTAGILLDKLRAYRSVSSGSDDADDAWEDSGAEEERGLEARAVRDGARVRAVAE
jgi:hypothetical protein